jgi:Arc/MetJ-type ribon-helix-helix transcriptional regulator
MKTTVLSLRLPEDVAEDIRAVAYGNRISLSKALRTAVEDYVAKTVEDQAFQRRIKQRIKDDVKAGQQLAARVAK